MRLSASRSCLVAGAKPRRVLPRAGAITSRFESLEKLWRRRDERTSFGPSRRDSNPCFSLERASPCVVISPTSTPGATARCHSRPDLFRGCRHSFDDLPGPSRPVRSRKLSSCARRPRSVALTQKDQSANFWTRVNRRPLGYEPFSNQHQGQRAPNSTS